jgi:hypothetical protein
VLEKIQSNWNSPALWVGMQNGRCMWRPGSLEAWLILKLGLGKSKMSLRHLGKQGNKYSKGRRDQEESTAKGHACQYRRLSLTKLGTT